MDEFLEQFVIEARELVEQGLAAFGALQSDPRARAPLDDAFRAFHTLKGGAAIVDFDALIAMMHACEEVLSDARSGKRILTRDDIQHSLRALDQVTQWLDHIERTGALPPDASASAATLSAPPSSASLAVEPLALLREQIDLLRAAPAFSAGLLAAAARIASNIAIEAKLVDEAARLRLSASQSESAGDALALLEVMEEIARRMSGGTPGAAAQDMAPEAMSRSMRVDFEKIDAIAAIVGEISVSVNALDHLSETAQARGDACAPALARGHAQLARLAGLLMAATQDLRVLSMRSLFQRVGKVVRDVSSTLSKPVDFVCVGEETLADKAIVEILYEPLLHAVRNAIDHGVESREARLARGKPATATVRLEARRESGRIVVELTDDGGGLDTERIAKRAQSRGMISAQAAQTLTDADAAELLFAPGFSTAEAVTSLSGRGVGLDAVRGAATRVGGRVEILSRRGEGATLRMTLPFSTMLTPIVTARSGGQTFGLPSDAVIETVRAGKGAIAPIGAGFALAHRSETIPVVDLAPQSGAPVAEGAGAVTLMIARSRGHKVALKVDAVGEPMAVMLKPPDDITARLKVLAGTAILGDGSVLLVLDLDAIAV